MLLLGQTTVFWGNIVFVFFEGLTLEMKHEKRDYKNAFYIAGELNTCLSETHWTTLTMFFLCISSQQFYSFHLCPHMLGCIHGTVHICSLFLLALNLIDHMLYGFKIKKLLWWVSFCSPLSHKLELEITICE